MRTKPSIPNGTRRLYEFGDFQLDPERHLLLRRGEVVPLSPKAIDLLILFARNPGKVLERDALMETLWADTIVEDANLTVAISNLRKVLGQNGKLPRFIETIPRVGYRFVGEVQEITEDRASYKSDLQTPDRSPNGNGVRADERENAFSGNGTSERSMASQMPEVAVFSPARRSVWWKERSLLAIAALLVLVVAGFFFFAREGLLFSRSTGPTPIKSVAVLPFKLIGQPTVDDEYLSLGLSDSLSTRLSRLKQFALRPTSSLRLNGDEQDPVSAGRQLGVEGVIDGLLQHDGDRVRLTARLLRTSDGALLWSDSFNGLFTNLFDLEDDISHQVVKALQLKLTTEEQQQLARRGTVDPNAFRAYLHGRYAWNKRTAESTRKAITLFKEAIEYDPAYAAAYAGLADCYLALGDYGDASPHDSFPMARGAALRALEIDDSLAEAHAALAQVRFLFDWDWAAAEREFLRAIERRPNYATAHHWYGMFLAAMGRFEAAMPEIKRAEDLDPLSLIIRANVGTIHYFARRYDQAIAQEQKVLKENPDFVQARRKLAYTLEAAGMEEEAVAEWLKVEQALGANEQILAEYRSACTAKGLSGYWLQAIEVEKKEGNGTAGALSSYYARLGDRDQALFWLEQAVEQKVPWLVYAKVTPVYDNLRSDPRFDAFLKRLGLAEFSTQANSLADLSHP